MNTDVQATRPASPVAPRTHAAVGRQISQPDHVSDVRGGFGDPGPPLFDMRELRPEAGAVLEGHRVLEGGELPAQLGHQKG